MAWLQTDPSGNFHVSFRFGGMKFKRSLKTKSGRDATARVRRLEETIRLVVNRMAREEPMTENKPFCISKWLVYQAWLKVRANGGSAGVDGVTIEEFEKKLKINLYRVWNRPRRATQWLRRIARRSPELFARWEAGFVP